MISSCRRTACDGRSLIIRWQFWHFICRSCSSVRITTRFVFSVSHRPEVLVADEYCFFYVSSFILPFVFILSPVGLYRKCVGCGNILQMSTRKYSTPWGWTYCGLRTLHLCLWVAFAFRQLAFIEFLTLFVPLFAFFFAVGDWVLCMWPYLFSCRLL